MKTDPMKEALKHRANKVTVEISVLKDADGKDREALGLAPDTQKGKGKTAPDTSEKPEDKMMAEGDPKKGPMEDGDADLKTILDRMGDMGNVKGSLSGRAKEGMKNKLDKKV